MENMKASARKTSRLAQPKKRMNNNDNCRGKHDLAEPLTPTAVCFEDWEHTFDTIVMGVAYDQHGMQTAAAWPDGTLQLDVIPWAEVSLGVLTRPNFLQWVGDVYIDPSAALVPGASRKSLSAFHDELLRMAETHWFRVQMVPSGVAPWQEPLSWGAQRAVQLATMGFRSKVGWLLRTHEAEVEKDLQK